MRRVLAAILFALIAACHEPTPLPGEKPVASAIAPPAAEIPLPADPADVLALERALKKTAPRAQTFSVRADTTSLVCGKLGSRIHVNPEDLQFADGSSASGSIDVSLLEVQHQGDFVRSGVPTTSDGRLLESGGSYFVEMSSGGKSLGLKSGRTLRMILPKYARKDMQLFYGDRRNGSVNWKPTGLQINEMANGQNYDYAGAGYPLAEDSVEVKIRVPQYRDSILMDMEVMKNGKRKTLYIEQFRHLSGTALKLINYHLYFVCSVEDTSKHVYETRCKSQNARLESQFYEIVNANRMGWVNCDRFIAEETYALTGIINKSSGVRFAKLYLIYKDINSVARHDIFATNAAAGFADKVPANRSVQVLAVSWKDGSPYLFSQKLRLQGSRELVLDLKPVSEKRLLDAMQM